MFRHLGSVPRPYSIRLCCSSCSYRERPKCPVLAAFWCVGLSRKRLVALRTLFEGCMRIRHSMQNFVLASQFWQRMIVWLCTHNIRNRTARLPSTQVKHMFYETDFSNGWKHTVTKKGYRIKESGRRFDVNCGSTTVTLTRSFPDSPRIASAG